MKQDRNPVVPAGGLAASERALRKWKWQRPQLSAPVRCKKDNWYLLRAQANNNGHTAHARVGVRFLLDDDPLQTRTVQLSRAGDTLVGWVQAPDDATHLQVQLYGETPSLDKLVLFPAAERDPKCHPYANTPAWSSYKPPFPIERVLVPPRLESLQPHVRGPKLEAYGKPRSLSQFAKQTAHAALVLDRDMVKQLGLDYSGLLRLAANSWVVLDLETLADLVRYANLADAKVSEHRSSNDIMSARVEYADVPTRGFALFDVLPYAVMDEEGGFATRVLRANKSWKNFGDETGFAPLMTSETPWEDRCGDVLSCARPVEGGELIGCDLPWMVAGDYGPLLAPRLAGHLLNAHLGGKVEEGVQYWNRWEYGKIVVRDIADLARRYRPLQTMRWAGEGDGLLQLGLALETGTDYEKTLLLRTGRIDTLAPHDGIPPEAMMILMKWIGREWMEQTSFARRYLARTRVIWQFDAGDGLSQATHFQAAPERLGRPRVVSLRTDEVAQLTRIESTAYSLPRDTGVHGDGSLDLQEVLTGLLRKLLKQG